MTHHLRAWLLCTGAAAAGLVLAAAPAGAQSTTPPDLSVCDGVGCDTVQDSVCSAAGFEISLVDFTPGSASDGGAASFTYEICSPAPGVCSGTVRPGQACLDHDFCRRQGPNEDPTAACSRECAVDSFRGLSHFDVTFPEVGATCLSEDTTVSGTCSVGTFVLGDGSCFGGGSEFTVAKCDETDLAPGECLTMTLEIAGETVGLGAGPAVVVDKEATTCTASCLLGPSCEACGGGGDGEECLTRTIGFWGTHPWITNDYAPVTVCGKTIGCNGAPTANSDPGCPAGTCDSVIEGLCSIPAELHSNQAYVSMVRQLTAAKLNLNATGELVDGATCSGFTYQDRSIQEWIAFCEGLCGANKATISNSGCIEALDAFNNSQDTGFDVTPAPFDQPGTDDFGNTSGADPSECVEAHGNQGNPKLVIGKNVGGNDCRVRGDDPA